MKTTTLILACLGLASTACAQETKTKEGYPVVLPEIRQLTLQGLYGENKLVRTAGNPLLGFTYSHFGSEEIHIGEEAKHLKAIERLHLPNFGWFFDALTGSRAGTRVKSFGLGGVVRLTSTPLKEAQGALNRWYYGAGMGLYATRVEGARSTTGIGLGSRFFAGKDFTDGSLIELSYSYRPGTQGVHPSGLALGLGRRF